MKYLITGGCGFLGTNLCREVLRRGESLTVLDNLFRAGSEKNLSWLKTQGDFKYLAYDIRSYEEIEHAIVEVQPDIIFHLAGQVAMTTSIDNPRLDFEINALGTHNLLESIRKHCPKAIVFYSSTNKVYGDFESLSFREGDTRYICNEFPDGFDENMALSFQSPYGCSKGAADQYLLDYARIYGIKSCVFRHSSMYGGNQNASYDQGWVGWFCEQALAIKAGAAHQIQISGSGKQVRDVLHADDVVNLYFTSIKNINEIAGKAFNVGGGTENSLSLLELFNLLEEKLQIRINIEHLPWRTSDQKVFVSDNSKIFQATKWRPKINKELGIDMTLEFISSRS